MSGFDTVLMVDWSGGNDRGPSPKADAIWTCAAGEAPLYHRNRQLAEGWLATRIEAELAAHGLSNDLITIHMTGCPNGCARPYTPDVGLVGKARPPAADGQPYIKE